MWKYVTQFGIVLLATSSSISDGMQYGWCSPSIPKLLREDATIQVRVEDTVWLDSIYLIGGIAGIPFTIYSCDRLGRKRSILAASLTYIVAWLLLIFADRVEYIFAARFLAGLGGNISFVCIPMYIGEIAHKNIRGFLGAFLPIMVQMGVILVYSIAPFLSVSSTALVGLFFPLFQLCTFSFMPDSPYFLLMKDRQDDANRALKILRPRQDIAKEFEEMKDAVDRQQGESGRFVDMFTSPTNSKALLIMTFLNGAQHFGAISIMIMNLHTILQDVTELVSTTTAAIIFSFTMLVSTILGSLLLDTFGRKALLIASSILTATCLFGIAIYFNLKSTGVVEGYSWIPALCAVLYALTFRVGLGVIPLVVTGEIFSTSIKAYGMTFSDIAYIVFGVITINIFHHMVATYGMYSPFYLFGSSCLLVAVLTFLYLPETKGKTLEEIQMLLKNGARVPMECKEDSNVMESLMDKRIISVKEQTVISN